MSKSSNRTPSTDKDASTTEDKPRLSLTRERVKDLRVQSGCKTGGLFNINQGPVGYTNNTARCH